MNIGIDARFALWKVRGTGRYVRELVKNLALLDDTNTYYLYVDTDDTGNIFPKKDNFIVKKLKSGFWPFYEQIFLPIRLYKDKIDVFHAPGSTSPVLLPRNTKLILTIFDVVFLKPNSPKGATWYQKFGKIYRRLFVPLVSKKASAVITASKAQKADMIKYLNKSESDVTVIHLGIDEFVRKKDAVLKKQEEIWDKLKNKYAIAGSFIFVVGGTAPVKLTLEAIQVFEQLLNKTPDKNIFMVVAGLGGAGDTHLHRYVSERHLGKNVIFTEYLSDEEMIVFYAKARVFLYFLVSNGFELPIVEAMSCGAPCVFSQTPPIPELYGGAGIVVDHFNFEEVVDALYSIISSDIAYSDYSSKSLDRASQFSSITMAKQTLALYLKFPS